VVSRFDEYLVHETEQTLARVAWEHPEWQDSFHFNVHDRDGEVALMTGLGAYGDRRAQAVRDTAGRIALTPWPPLPCAGEGGDSQEPGLESSGRQPVLGLGPRLTLS